MQACTATVVSLTSPNYTWSHIVESMTILSNKKITSSLHLKKTVQFFFFRFFFSGSI